MTTQTTAPNGGTAVSPAASVPAARPDVEPATLARWSSAMSAAAQGMSSPSSKPGAARTQEQAPSTADDAALADGAAFDGAPVDETANPALHRAHERRPQASEAHALWAPRTGGAAPEAGAPAALSLRELRARHVDHREAQFDAGSDGPASGSASRTAADQLQPRGEPVLIGAAMPATMAADPFAASGSAGPTDQLQSLIESCCSRMWVSERGDGAHAPRGVMLDLGSWMPGCTLEVARAAGTLRIMLRGVHDERRHGLERELEGLGAGLAEKLGCQVVTAVEPRGAMR